VISGLLFIEIQGDYWHANPLRYKTTDMFLNGRTASEIWRYDAEKKSAVVSSGKQYLELWEHELNSMSDEEVLGRIDTAIRSAQQCQNQQ
jgi:hypothetical protein